MLEMQETSEKKQNIHQKGLGILPLDIMLYNIMLRLSPKDLAKLGEVSKRYNALSKNEQIQRAQLQRHFPAALKQFESKTPPFDYQACFNKATKEQYKNLSPLQKELFYYTKEGNLEAIKNLISTLSPNYLLDNLFYATDIHDRNAIMWAHIRHQAILDYFYHKISKGSLYIPSVHRAIICCRPINEVSSLINNNKNKNIIHVKFQGFTPLELAVKNEHIDVVRLLLNKGAQVNPVDFDRAPLHRAARKGHLEIIQLLLNKDADPNILDANQTTPLHIVAENGHLEIVQLLVNKNAEVDTADNLGKTPLYMAAEKGHLEIIQLLLNKDAQVDTADNFGKTPLYIAAEKGHLEIIQLLLNNNADSNAKHWDDGTTPLYIAAEKGHKDVVQLLLNNNAQVNTADNFSRTPLYTAIKNGHVDVVQLLLNNGARPDNHQIPNDIKNPEIILLLEKQNQSTNKISGKALQLIYRQFIYRQYRGSFFQNPALFSKSDYEYKEVQKILLSQTTIDPENASSKMLTLLQKHYPQEECSPAPNSPRTQTFS